MNKNTFSCPGATRIKDPIPEFFKCPNCGAEVEIWTNEYVRKCSKCQTEVVREGVPTCIEWCEYGKECVGEEAYDRYMKAKGGEKEEKIGLEEEEAKLKELIEKIKEKCERRRDLDGKKRDNKDR